MTARHAPLILLVCAGLLAAGLWFLADESGAPRGAVERGPEPTVSVRELIGAPESEPVVEAAPQLSAPREPGAPAPEESAPPEPAFLGRVVDASGVPVAGARVFALRGNRSDQRLSAPDEVLRRSPRSGTQALTDGAGRFRMPLAPDDLDGDYRLAVRADGFAPLERRLAARAGGQALGDLVLERGVALSGVVRDSAGQPVAGALLRGLDVENRSGSPISSESGEQLATTDERGAFRTDRLASGPWKLLITSEQHPDALEEGETSAPGEELTGLVFVLADGLEIQGSVLAPPEVLEEAVVRALPLRADASGTALAALPRSARCAADGSFVVRGLQSGWTYRLAAWRGEQATSARPGTDWAEAAGGARGLALVFEPERALVLQVVDAVSGAALIELEARAGCGFPTPLVGADGRVRREFQEGRVRFPILFECGGKPLELWLSAPGYEDRIVGDLLLADGQALDLGVIGLEPVPILSVRVVSDAGGTAVEGAEVVVVPEPAAAPDGPWNWGTAVVPGAADDPPWRRARTDHEGRARLNGIPGVVLVRHPDFSPLTGEPLGRYGSGEVELTLRLRAGGRVTVEVVDERGNPVASAWVRRTSTGPTTPAARADTERTDREGRSSFEHLEAGLHRFEAVVSDPAALPAREPVAGEITVSEGGEHTLRLVVPAR